MCDPLKDFCLSVEFLTNICLTTNDKLELSLLLKIMQIKRSGNRKERKCEREIRMRERGEMEEKEQEARREGGGRRGGEEESRLQSPQSTVGSTGPTFFTIVSDTGCLILILLVKKYLSRYKNKPTENYKLSGLKTYSCLCGGGRETSTDMNHSP